MDLGFAVNSVFIRKKLKEEAWAYNFDFTVPCCQHDTPNNNMPNRNIWIFIRITIKS